MTASWASQRRTRSSSAGGACGFWSGRIGDAAREVEAARAAQPEWAARSLAYRMEAVRRFATAMRLCNQAGIRDYSAALADEQVP